MPSRLARRCAVLYYAAGSAVAEPLRTGELNRGFAFRQIAKSIIGPAQDVAPAECEQGCFADDACVSWQVCAPVGNGCDGCYHLRNHPELIVVDGWSAGVIEERARAGNLTIGEQVSLPSNVTMPTTSDGCREFLLSANGGAPDSDLDLSIYNRCGEMLRQGGEPKHITVLGQHFATSLVSNFRDPSVVIPPEVEQQRRSSQATDATSANASDESKEGGWITDELHRSANTEVHTPTRNHAFVIPFYDTNIAHGIMQTGTMNIIQNYEMQALLRPGDVVVDAGANLGAYTIPFAERVGPRGKVLAFEPFRWLHQLTTANVALNGLSNVYTYNVALGESKRTFRGRPPQLRFFSSPGGVKVNYAEVDGNPGAQEQGGNINQAVQMYDFESEPEDTLMISLDELFTPGQSDLRLPPIDNLRLIKIDVEGMESNIIMGAQRMIQHFKPIIWSENADYFEKNDVKFVSLLDQLEYACAKAPAAPQDLVCTDRHGRGHQITYS